MNGKQDGPYVYFTNLNVIGISLTLHLNFYLRYVFLTVTFFHPTVLQLLWYLGNMVGDYKRGTEIRCTPFLL